MRPARAVPRSPALLLCLSILAAALPARAPASPLEELEQELNRQVETASVWAVTVVAISPVRGGGEEGEGEVSRHLTGEVRRSIGCGVVIDSLGHILTTSSVVEGATRVELYTQRRRVPARLVGDDPFTDLALLRAEGGEWRGAVLGDSELLDAGSWVTVIGNSYGAGLSVATGVVSRRRPFYGIPGVSLIQMNVPIKPGDTGGMVLNSRGEVVGIVCASLADPRQPQSNPGGAAPGDVSFWEGTGIGFAMPIATAMRVARRFMEGERPERGFLGVEIRDLAAYGGDESSSLSSGVPASGVQVIQVLASGPAHLAGIRRGDILLEAAGRPIPSARELSSLVIGSPPGTAIDLLLRRGQETLILTAVVGTRPPRFPPALSTPPRVPSQVGADSVRGESVSTGSGS